MESVRQLQKRKGLSPVEVLFAMAILIFSMLAIIHVFPVVFEMNSSSWRAARVMKIAQKIMDEEQAKGLESTLTVHARPIRIRGRQVGTARIWRVDCPEADSTMQMVYVDVSWLDQGRTKQFRLTSSVGLPD